MVCIYCGKDTQVVNSRLQRRPNQVWRRRKCVGCGARFTTEEQTALHSSLMVAAPHNRLSPFSRDQLFISVYESCRHRANAVHDATALTQTILSNLVQAQRSGTVLQHEIAQAVHAVLKRFDETAATVYAAYHPLTPKAEEPSS